MIRGLHILYTDILSILGPFIKSVPQMYLTLIVVSIADGQDDFANKKAYIALISSMVSATYGLSKVLLEGPVKLVPSNRGLPFSLLFLCMLTCLAGKVAWLPAAIFLDMSKGALVWFAVMITPQAAMVSSNTDQACNDI